MRALLRSPTLALAMTVFLAATAVAVGLAFAGSPLLEDRRVSVPLLLTLLLSGVLAFLGWSAARAAAEEVRAEYESTVARRQAEARANEERLQAELAETRDRAERERREREEAEREFRARLEGQEKALRETRADLEARIEERERELAHERRTRERTEQSRREEREWALHLRKEILRLQTERGTIGDTSDVRALVLRVAITLVGASKGLLLSREDLDSDQMLDLICHEGFEHDPGGSGVAQRFAEEVIEKDVTIREDDEPDIAPERRTPADDEIENLLAIPIYIADRFGGVVVLANREGGFHEYDDDVLLALGDHAGATLQNARLQSELRTSYVGTVRVLADAIEAKDRFLRGHADEVTSYVAAVAERLGLEPKLREELVYSSLLHDVGKIGISERVLMKPADLTPEERSIVQLHPRIGYRLVQQVPALRPTELAVLHHHERWDGGGYPAGLRGEDIPLEARIVAVADAFSAMTSDRPYRRRMSVEEACQELERYAGTQFDPVVVRLFVDEVRRNPPSATDGDALHTALADPEIDLRKNDEDPILGPWSFALTDNLTLLYSHRYFHEIAEVEGRRAALQRRPFSVLVVELRDVARVNAEQGYAAGDAVIQRAAKALQRVAARVGGTPCRIGGRRLGLVVPGDERTAETCASDFTAELAGGAAVALATATWRPGDSGEAVIERAQTALAAARPAWPPATPGAADALRA